MGHLRPRYNKARQDQLDARRQGKKKDHGGGDESVANQEGLGSNADILLPKTAAEKAKERELRRIQEENESKGKMSSKKRKRLDNYVEKKLKAERRGELFKELEASQNTITTPLLLQPTSTLGSKQFKTNQEKLDKSSSLVDRRRGRVLDTVAKKKAGYHSDEEEEELPGHDEIYGNASKEIQHQDRIDDAEPSTSNLSHSQKTEEKPETETETKPSNGTFQAGPSISQAVGSGLMRNPDGTAIIPVVVKRKRKAVQRRRFNEPQIKPHLRGLGLEASDTESEFDSSDSEYDTHSDNDSEDEDEDPEQGDGPDEESEDGVDLDENEEEEEWTGLSSAVDGEEEDDERVSERKVHFEDADGEVDQVLEGEDEEAEEDEDESESSDESAGSEDSEQEGEETSLGKRKRGGFKEWANQQLGIQTRSEEGTPLQPSGPLLKQAKRQEGPIRGPLGEELVVPSNSLLTGPSSSSQAQSKAKDTTTSTEAKKSRRVVSVDRPEEIQAKRLQLPILAEEDTIMEAIRLHSVVVLCGETGSGKTTQVPQFLYEAGFGNPGSDNPGMIGITQPRRVAAMSMATRVAEELVLPSSRVSYQIRYDATTSSSTSIKFMTDGVLLRELANDFLLNRYSVVIVDEAHERSVNTDVLIGTLSRVVKLREEMWREGKSGIKPLRLIIMSATLRVTDFTENSTLFKIPPPLINISARQHPVAMHFNRKTRPDYLDEAYKKVSKIHARLPSGGVLVFLTGQNEITTLCRRLEKRFGQKAISERMQRRQKLAMGSESWRGIAKKSEETVTEKEENGVATSSRQNDVEAEEIDLGNEDQDLAADVDDGAGNIEEDPDDLDSDGEYEADDPDGLFADREEESDTPLHILPLYSLLPTDKQMRVFKEPPEGHRLVVVATNVAETSLTIPNIKYVVDCGRAKERRYDTASGIQSFEVSWISKASASQRAGRAGRTGPGHCYRLFSSAVFETHCEQHTSPEITRMPIEGIVLQMKSMNIDAVVNFPFPTPPDRAALLKAEKILVNLGALTAPSSTTSGSGKNVQARITELGNAMSLFPLSPRFSKMLVVGQQHGCLPYVIALVSALSVGDPFLRAEALGFGLEDRDEGEEESSEKAMLADEGSEIRHIKNGEVKAKEVRKLQRRAYYQVQQRHSALGKSSSDIFKMLSVVGAYEYDGGSISFCDQNYVRVKAMQEIHKLRHQVSRIVSANYPGLESEFDPKLRPPSDTQLKVLRQLLTAAFIDQVAVRKDLLFPGQAPDGSKFASTRGIAYRAIGVDQDVYVHPSSVLFHTSPPECVVYQELVQTSKLFIRVVTKINSAWLPTLGKPLCSFSRILETPSTSKATKLKDTTLTTSGAGGTTPNDADERECFVQPKFADFDNLQLAPVKVTQKRIGSRWIFV